MDVWSRRRVKKRARRHQRTTGPGLARSALPRAHETDPVTGCGWEERAEQEGDPRLRR